MGALTADLNMSTFGDVVTLGLYANVAETYYRGSLVFADAAGGVQKTPDGTDYFVGISPSKQVIANVGDSVEVVVEGFVELPIPTGLAATDEGILFYVDVGGTLSDNIADCVVQTDTAIANADTIVGRVFKYNTTTCIFKITHGLGTAANAFL